MPALSATLLGGLTLEPSAGPADDAKRAKFSVVYNEHVAFHIETFLVFSGADPQATDIDISYISLDEVEMLSRSLLRARPRVLTYNAIRHKGTFLGLQRTPPPKPAMAGYLVAQGLVVVLFIDLGIATAMGDKTTVRSVCQAAGLWKDLPAFDDAHGTVDPTASKG